MYQEATFHLPERRWVTSREVAQVRGSYRSVSVAVEWEEVRPSGGTTEQGGTETVADRLTASQRRRSGERGGDVLTPAAADAFLFSNANFTDVQRSLHALSLDDDDDTVRMTDMTPQLNASPTTTQPPGLRFPFAAHVGGYLVVGGTYLSASAQQFALWALDLRGWTWRKVDAEVLEGMGHGVRRQQGGLPEDGLAGGSWNRAVWWEQGRRLVVFGNRYRGLQEDCEFRSFCFSPRGFARGLIGVDEHRAINLDHVAIIDLEVFGIYRAPERMAGRDDDRARVEVALAMLHEERLADCRVVAEDGRAVRCSKRILQARWTWYKDRSATCPGDTIHISESYPIVMAFLEYLYTLDLVTMLQHRVPVLSGLLMLAKQYGIPHLEALAVHALHGRLEEGTALGIYEVATLCECVSLQVRALKMVLVSRARGCTPVSSWGLALVGDTETRGQGRGTSEAAIGRCAGGVRARARAVFRGRFCEDDPGEWVGGGAWSGVWIPGDSARCGAGRYGRFARDRRYRRSAGSGILLPTFGIFDTSSTTQIYTEQGRPTALPTRSARLACRSAVVQRQ